MANAGAPHIDLMDGDFYAGDPFPAFAWMRRQRPRLLRRAQRHLGRHPLRGRAGHRAGPPGFSSTGGSRPNTPLPYMIDMDAPEHRRRRRLVSAGFTPQAVRDREPRIRQVCDEILDRVCEKGACDLVADIAAPLPLVLIADMLGFDPKDWERLLEWSDTMLMSQGSKDPDAMTKAATAFVEWDGFIRELIDERRRAMSADDLLGVLVQGEVDGERIDDTSLVYESLLLLIGGDETSRHVISGGMEALLRRPDQFEDLRGDRELLPGAVEEMLRWVTPIKNFNRRADA